MEFVRLGEMDGGMTDRLAETKAVWESGTFKVLTFDDIHKMVWEKLICNCTYSGTCCLTGLTISQVQADPDAWAVASACASEAFAVAKAKGIAVDIEEPVSYVKAFGEKIPNARPSMLLDHMAGRRCEIEVINGAIPREAAALGMEAPVNTVVSQLVRGREAGFEA